MSTDDISKSPYADGGRTLGPRMSVDDEAEAVDQYIDRDYGG